MRFKNPENGYVEEKSVPWLWALLFSGLYFIANGLWGQTIIWFAIASLLVVSMGPPGLLLVAIVNIIYAFLATKLIRGAYLRKGWDEVPNNAGLASAPMQGTAMENKICPFCAETIKAEAIKCRYCGTDLPSAVKSEAAQDGAESMGTCPNCYSVIPLASSECPKCAALFGANSLQKVNPIDHTDVS